MGGGADTSTGHLPNFFTLPAPPLRLELHENETKKEVWQLSFNTMLGFFFLVCLIYFLETVWCPTKQRFRREQHTLSTETLDKPAPNRVDNVKCCPPVNLPRILSRGHRPVVADGLRHAGPDPPPPKTLSCQEQYFLLESSVQYSPGTISA